MTQTFQASCLWCAGRPGLPPHEVSDCPAYPRLEPIHPTLADMPDGAPVGSWRARYDGAWSPWTGSAASALGWATSRAEDALARFEGLQRDTGRLAFLEDLVGKLKTNLQSTEELLSLALTDRDRALEEAKILKARLNGVSVATPRVPDTIRTDPAVSVDVVRDDGLCACGHARLEHGTIPGLLRCLKMGCECDSYRPARPPKR